MKSEINNFIVNDLAVIEPMIIDEHRDSVNWRIVRYIRENLLTAVTQRSTHVQVLDGEEFIPLPSLDLGSENEVEDNEAEDEEVDDDKADELSLSSEDECHRIICKEISSESINHGDCSICLDIIQTNANSSTTRCGHSFHTSCFLKAIQCGSGNCPNCRAILVVKDSDDDDDSDNEDSDNEDSDNEDSDNEDSVNEYETTIISDAITLEQVANKLQNLGYSTADILCLYLGKSVRSNTDERYNIEFFLKINEVIKGILDGSIQMSQRDNRSFRDVVASSTP